MSKKIRRSVRGAGAATVNFGKWVPKAAKHFLEEIPPTASRLGSWFFTFRGVLAALCLIGALFIPLLTANPYFVWLFMIASIYTIFAASWDFLAGFVGQVSFGHAAFFGIGGYFAAGIVIGLGGKWGTPWYTSLLFGGLVAVLFGLIVGIPCLRLRGPYLTLGTLAFSLILLDLFQSGTLLPYLHGSAGISGVRPPSWDPVKGISNPVIDYLVVFVVMLLSLVVMLAITRSRVGTVFKSIRDDEVSAEAAGINTTKYKLFAFMVSSFFAGIAGGLFALTNRAANPAYFNTLYSFYPIIMAAMGGVGTIFGSIGGAYIYTFVSFWLLDLVVGFPEATLFVFGLLLIIVFRFASSGFVNPFVDRLKEFWQAVKGK